MTHFNEYGSHSAEKSRWLGVDFGRVRSGFAISDPSASLASPLCTLPTEPRVTLGRRLLAELERHGFAAGELAGLICGLPLDARGQESDMSAWIRPEMDSLRGQLCQLSGIDEGPLPLHYVDERYSSRDMNRRGIELKLSAKGRKASLDAWAATSILQDWLDRRMAQAGGSESGAAEPDSSEPS